MTRRPRRVSAALLAGLGMLCAISCGRYGPPVRAESEPTAASAESETEPAPRDEAAEDTTDGP